VDDHALPLHIPEAGARAREDGMTLYFGTIPETVREAAGPGALTVLTERTRTFGIGRSSGAGPSQDTHLRSPKAGGGYLCCRS
jgi:hypothetical protein